jgi:hypothetical protein
MPKAIIAKLSDEQAAMISIYREKWRSIDVSTEPIDREKVAEVIKAAYLAINYPEPEILFYSNPLKAIQETIIVENFRSYLGRDIHTKFTKRVTNHLTYGLKHQLDDYLFTRLHNQIHFPDFPYYPTRNEPRVSYFPCSHSILRCIECQLLADMNKPEAEFTDISYFLTTNFHRPAGWAFLACVFDFCISVLGLHHDQKKWKIFQELVQYCGFLFQYEKVCIACDRPCNLSFDRENLLHADLEPALQFADGYNVYANHGKHPSEESEMLRNH